MPSIPRPARNLVLYSAGHLGSAMIMSRPVAMDEIEVVGVVKAQPLPLPQLGKQRIHRHLQQGGGSSHGYCSFSESFRGLVTRSLCCCPGCAGGCCRPGKSRANAI